LIWQRLYGLDLKLIHFKLFVYYQFLILSQVISCRCEILDAGHWILDAGYWMLDAGFWILDTGYWMLDTGCWALDSDFMFFVWLRVMFSIEHLF